MEASKTVGMVCLLVAGLLTGTADALTMETVPVGNPGNAPDTRYNSIAVGGVSYTYNIGKYEVTTSQYTEFLNAVAKTDTYGLYNTNMADPYTQYVWGCNIGRSQNAPYTYTVGDGSQADVTNWGNRPVNWVSWGDAARFANWLSNGQKSGSQDSTTTEDGLYYLNGATTNAALQAVARKPGVGYAIPTEDEWYKAAYYDQNYGGLGVSGYWDYPTSSNTIDTGMANYDLSVGHTTDVGIYGSYPSPYGTFDQGGNVFERNQAVIGGSDRGLRGGSFDRYDGFLHASRRGHEPPTFEYFVIGFRVVEVPEPCMMLMLALASVGMLPRRRTIHRFHR